MRGLSWVAAAMLLSGCTITIVEPNVPRPVEPQPPVPQPTNPPVPVPLPSLPKPQPPFPTAIPSAVPSGVVGSPTPYPSAVPSYSANLTTIVSGKITDEDGAVVNNAKVRLRSLNPAVPYESTVDVVNGAYVINMVPTGVQMELQASKDGWTRRARVVTPLPQERMTFDFSRENGLFISDRPEIERVSPEDGATQVDTSKVAVQLTLSEPLDVANQRRFAQAIRILPANRAADPQGTGELTDYNALPKVKASEGGKSTQYSWSFAQGSAASADDVAVVTWDAEGRVATFSFKEPLPRASEGTPAYQVALIGSGPTIYDANGNMLGSGDGVELDVPYAADTLILQAFRRMELPEGPADRPWAATHQHASVFKGN